MESELGPFIPEEVERARRYHRPTYVVGGLHLILGLGVLALFAFGPPGDWLGAWVDALAWWAGAPLLTAFVLIVSWLVGLPISFWRGYVHEHEWGFSTQTLRGWLVDRLKGLAIGVILTSGLMTGFVWVARWLPDAWPLVLAPAAMAVVLVLSFVAPVLLEPVFNRFAPLQDEALAAELRGLSERAGVPVAAVQVADASRRTRKENAYVSGLGATRRVVLFDTLVARGDPTYTKLVVAHELGHRRMRHVAWGTLLAMVGAGATVLLVWVVLRSDAILDATGATGVGHPRIVPFVLLFASVLQLVTAPLSAALSRRWERAADRFSLEQTDSLQTFESTHRELALSNLLDLDPPRLIYLWAFSHPTPPERIAEARRWSAYPRSITNTPPPIVPA